MALDGRQRVLVVDDEDVVRRVVSATLRRHGFGVAEAGSGDEGLLYFSEHRDGLSLIITDVMMPGMSGPAMVERILAIDPEMPIMFMTGTAADARQMMGRIKRCSLLQKPFTPDGLLMSVRKCLDGGGR